MLARVVDTLSVGGILIALLYFLNEPFTVWMPVALASMLVFLMPAHFVGLYRSWRSEGFYRQIMPAIIASSATILTLVCVVFVAQLLHIYSIHVFVYWLLLSPLLIVLWRGVLNIFLVFLRHHGFNLRRTAVLGATALGAELIRIIENDLSLGLQFQGIYDDRIKQGRKAPPWHPVSDHSSQADSRIHPSLQDNLSGNFNNLLNHARSGEIDIIYITLPMRAEERTLQYLSALSDTTTSVYVVPDFFVFDLLHARVGHLGRLTTLSVFETPFIGVNGFIKRMEDLVAASIILMLVFIPMIFIAIAIKLTSPGPVIFKQQRYGVDGRPIEVWKFRSMTVMDNGGIVKQAQKNDVRITPIGSVLRRTSLDELPQFFNVIGGSMSIVGPRPHAVAHNEQYRKLVPGYMLRHKIKPGVTGWAQVNGWRGETDTLEKMEQRVRFDLDYIRNWSVLLDIKIIFMTIFRGFVHKNAY